MSAVATTAPGDTFERPTSDRWWKWTREQYHRLNASCFFEGARVELIRGVIVEKDITNRQLHVFRDPAPLPASLDAVAYATHLTLGPGEGIAPLSAPNRSVPVSDLLP